MPETTNLVDARVERGVGRLTLNRPAALNALTLGMVHEITAVLDRWRSQPLGAVLIESSSPRAFCAGGDIRAVRQNTLDGRPELNLAFFRTEYALNHTLATYPHPVVALIDGVCMGGGLGLSVHGPYLVVTERAVLAMPETAIGFFPDVGASHFLSRLPGGLGMYLGLTGARVDAADALYCGLATHLVSSEHLVSIAAAVAERGPASIEETLRRFATTPGDEGALARHRAEIDWCFGAPSIATIRERLGDLDADWARTQLDTLGRVSPQSLEVTFRLLTRGRERDLQACLSAELDAARRVTRTHDFLEGVRAVLVDKDHRPAWAPEDIAADIDVDVAVIDHR